MTNRIAYLFVLSAILVAGAARADDASSGETLFKQKCSACHQLSGKGVKGAFPALAGDPFVLGDPAAPVRIVLAGRGGMPTFKASLNDQQIADILSYVRQAWGNQAAPVPPTVVAETRATVGGDVRRDLGN